MAGRIEVAQGYVTIVPSLKGAQQRIASELTPAAVSAGKTAGEAIEKGIAQGAQRGAKEAGERISSDVPKSGDTAGKQAGEKLASGMKAPVAKASDQIAKDVQSKLGNAFKGMGDKLKSFGSSVGSSMSMTKSMFGEAFGEIGGQIKGSKFGQAFSGIASGAKGAIASATGTVKGFAGFMGSAFKGIAGKVGPALAVVGTVAKTTFDGVKSVAGTVASGVSSAFSSIGEKLKGPMSALGGMMSTAMKGIAAGAAAAGAALVGIGKSALDSFGNYEQLAGGIKLTLGDEVWDTVKERSKTAFSEMQISQNDYLEKVNLLATGLKESLGGDAQAAADLANDVIQAQADIVSAKGIDPQTVSDVFSAVARGSYQTLDSLGLGIKGTKEGMQDVIDKANEWRVAQGKAGDLTIDSMADCQQALVDYVDYLGMSGYAASEGADTVQGSISKMSAAWTDWTAELGKSDGDMGRVTQNLSESVQDVARNVLPVLSNAIGSAVQQLPGLVTTVGPELGNALVTIVDSATGGMATKALDMAQPITDALMGAFDGIGQWADEHSGDLDGLLGSFEEFGGKVAEFVGGAIETAGPIVEGFANGALATVPAVLDLVGGALDFAGGLASHFGEAFEPLGDILGPIASSIGGALLQGISDLGDALGSVDWDGWATSVSDALQSVVDFVSDRIEEIKGFFQGVGEFIKDPIGSIQDGLGDLFGATSATTDSVQGNFSSMAGSVQVSTSNMVGSISNVNNTKLKNQAASFTASGNVMTSKPADSISGLTSAASGLSSKKVDYTATGNITTGTTVADRIWATVKAVNNMSSKSIDVTTNYRTTGSGPTQAGKAAGGVVRRFAEGAVFTKATMTDIGIVGEAGAEAVYSNGRDTGIFPLTNRRFTGPFAAEIADQVLAATGSDRPTINITVTGVVGPDDTAAEVERRLRLLGF